MKWYLAGKMTGIPAFNFPAFDEACKRLRDAGHEIISPHESDSSALQAFARASPDGDASQLPPGESLGAVMGRDVRIVIDEVGGIIFLDDDWVLSKGARLEAFTGMLYGKQFREYDPSVEPCCRDMCLYQVRNALQRSMP